MEVYRTEKIYLDENEELQKLCLLSKQFYNQALYYKRLDFFEKQKKMNDMTNEQKIEYIKLNPYIRPKHIREIMRKDGFYQTMLKETSGTFLDLIFKNIEDSWKSFFKAKKVYFKDKTKFKTIPKIPRYNKNTKRFFTLRECDGKILDGFYIPPKKFNFKIPTRLKDVEHRSIRIIPKLSGFIAEISYKKVANEKLPFNNRIAGIDLGKRNFISLVTNIYTIKPVLVKGGYINGLNNSWNRRMDVLFSNCKHFENHLKKLGRKQTLFRKKQYLITEKRKRRMDGFFETLSSFIVSFLECNNINTLVVGYNKEWKQKINIGRKNNRSFVGIPYQSFLQKLKTKCENIGVDYKETEESFTSKCSFVDQEKIKHHKEYIGQRKNGLFKSGQGIFNADINAALNIIRKLFPNAFDHWFEGQGKFKILSQIWTIKHINDMKLFKINMQSLDKQPVVSM